MTSTQASNTHEGWSAHAKTWSKDVAEVTRKPCAALTNRADALLPLSDRNANVLDNGCGAGMMTDLLKSRYPDLRILATDISSGMTEAFEQTAKDKGWVNVSTQVLDAQDLGSLNDGEFTHAFSTFVLPFCPDAGKAVREMARLLKRPSDTYLPE